VKTATYILKKYYKKGERSHPDTVKWLKDRGMIKGKKKKVTRPNRQSIVFDFADKLRKNMTPAEKEIRKWLKHYHIKFQAQVPIFTDRHWYIMDFAIVTDSIRICIEVDGGYHLRGEVMKKDKIRDRELNKIGYSIIRMTNDEAINSPFELIGRLQFLGIHAGDI
jgi:very-short-patch-repair endonuclease